MGVNRHGIRATLLIGLALVTGACGENGQARGEAERVVDIEMVDNAFNPASLTVSSGETVTFRFTNNGSVAHDAFIGDENAQRKHAEDVKNDSGGHEHGGEGIVVDPGDTGELTYTFEEAKQILIGCHQPGHYPAGMKSTITVA